MANSVIISYNSASRKEQAFVKNLVDYLGMKGIDSVADDPNHSEPAMSQRLFRAQWLVVVLTLEAVRSRGVQSLVNSAFDRVRQRQMQGVLALAFSSNPVEPEDMPHSSWSTIRTYYVGESNEDHQRAFEKVARTLGYTTASTPATSSSTNNWASASGYQVPTLPRPARPRRMRLIISIIAALILIIFSASLLRNFLINNYQNAVKLDVVASVTANTQANATTTARTKATGTAQANATTTARTKATGTAQANATTTAQSPQAQDIYNSDTNGLPTFSMSASDKNQDWDGNATCMFINNGTYQVTNTNVGQYTPCMARKTNFKNFAYQVQMTIKNGYAGGMIFRSNDKITMFYRFSLNSNGDYSLFICQPENCNSTTIGQGTPLENGSLDKQSNTLLGHSKTLTVIAKDNDIYLYIDRKFVDKVDGSAISGGEIGVYAASEDSSTVDNSTTKVEFSKMEVWEFV